MKKKVLSVFLSFCMIISCFVGFSVTAGAADPAILVTLGDSYSSGEGNPGFYGWSKRVGSDGKINNDWLAHRSPNAWAGMITLICLYFLIFLSPLLFSVSGSA